MKVAVLSNGYVIFVVFIVLVTDSPHPVSFILRGYETAYTGKVVLFSVCTNYGLRQEESSSTPSRKEGKKEVVPPS